MAVGEISGGASLGLSQDRRHEVSPSGTGPARGYRPRSQPQPRQDQNPRPSPRWRRSTPVDPSTTPMRRLASIPLPRDIFSDRTISCTIQIRAPVPHLQQVASRPAEKPGSRPPTPFLRPACCPTPPLQCDMVPERRMDRRDMGSTLMDSATQTLPACEMPGWGFLDAWGSLRGLLPASPTMEEELGRSPY